MQIALGDLVARAPTPVVLYPFRVHLRRYMRARDLSIPPAQFEAVRANKAVNRYYIILPG